MVDKGLALRPRDRLEMLAERDDVLMLHRDLVDDVQGVLDALFGLNRVFAPHPFHKWLDWEVSLLRVIPPDLAARVRRLLAAPPAAAVEQLCALVEETFALVERELPDHDVAAARSDFGFRRAT